MFLLKALIHKGMQQNKKNNFFVYIRLDNTILVWYYLVISKEEKYEHIRSTEITTGRQENLS